MAKPSAYEQFVPEGFALGFKQAFEEGYRQGLEEGCLLEARKLALKIGQNRFGPPDQTTPAKIESRLGETSSPSTRKYGPVLTRVLIDYRDRPIRWIDAARAKYTRELTNEQKLRFAARIGTRTLNRRPDND